MVRTPRLPLRPRRLAGRVAMGYAVLASLWILLSDRLLGALVHDPDRLVSLSVAKGWFFVAVTAVLLYGVVSTQADARLSLLHTILRARVTPFQWDPAQARWTFHPTGAALLGWAAEELARPGGVERLLAPEDLPRLARARVQGEQEGWATFEARLTQPDGQVRWTRWTLRRTALGFDGIVQDISEMRSLRDHLARRQKQEVLGLTVGGAAHDLKNVFQAVRSASELLADEVDPRHKGTVGILQKASQRGEALLRSLLRLVRDRNPEDHPLTDLNGLVRETVALLRLALPAAFQLETDLDPHVPLVPLDPGQVIQVLMNLGLNGRDAQGREGTLRFRTGRGTCPASTLPCVFVEVEDEGPGIPPEVHAKLFTPFFTTKPEGEGTGLGLASALAIAQAHGGTLTCDSAPGRGTRFRMSLPAGSPEDIPPR